METKIELKDLIEYMTDPSIEIKELWFDFGNDMKTQIRIMFNYVYSKLGNGR